MRVMQVDSEFAGLLVAVGFVVMGLVGIPIAKWFFLGTLVLGVAIAVQLHFIRKGWARPLGFRSSSGFSL